MAGSSQDKDPFPRSRSASVLLLRPVLNEYFSSERWPDSMNEREASGQFSEVKYITKSSEDAPRGSAGRNLAD